jgi:hypothetical protein
VNSSPCVSEIAHGIERSPWPASPCGVRRELTHGKISAVCLGPFAVCRRHTAYDCFPVVPRAACELPFLRAMSFPHNVEKQDTVVSSLSAENAHAVC